LFRLKSPDALSPSSRVYRLGLRHSITTDGSCVDYPGVPGPGNDGCTEEKEEGGRMIQSRDEGGRMKDEKQNGPADYGLRNHFWFSSFILLTSSLVRKWAGDVAASPA
jgi:hypothetical protein